MGRSIQGANGADAFSGSVGAITPSAINPFSGVFGLGRTEIFTASGTFTPPAGVTAVRVRVFGRGGDGSSTGPTYPGGGGGGFAMGVQWRPEYWVESDGPSARIFAAFGAALRARAAIAAARLAAE